MLLSLILIFQCLQWPRPFSGSSCSLCMHLRWVSVESPLRKQRKGKEVETWYHESLSARRAMSEWQRQGRPGHWPGVDVEQCKGGVKKSYHFLNWLVPFCTNQKAMSLCLCKISPCMQAVLKCFKCCMNHRWNDCCY